MEESGFELEQPLRWGYWERWRISIFGGRLHFRYLIVIVVEMARKQKETGTVAQHVKIAPIMTRLHVRTLL